MAGPVDPHDRVPLEPGCTGEAVRDLQRRLKAGGLDTPVSETGFYGDGTSAAVGRFQESRGLLASGICDRATWAQLVEAGWHLGDRLLYLRQPMLRGDDVADLQRRLSALGFDAGRVDGIFGPDTERALRDFQRNTALTTDGVCGRDVLAVLERLGGRTGAEPVAAVRERERLRRSPRALHGMTVVVAVATGPDAIAAAAARSLGECGAHVVVVTNPDPSAQARAANELQAAAFLGIEVVETGPGHVFYYSTEGFTSPGGRRLAEELVRALRRRAVNCADERGMRLPALRETRMPAVTCLLGPAQEMVNRAGDMARAVTTAVDAWVTTPVDQ